LDTGIAAHFDELISLSTGPALWNIVALPNLIVAGDTMEEVLSLVPQVAALIASMKAAGDPLPETLRVIPSLPFVSRVAVPA